MKTALSIDRSTGRIVDSHGSVVFDPGAGPSPAALTPNDVRSLFEATAEDGVKVSLSYVESGGGYLSLFAGHEKFGTSWDDWTEQKERARVAWLAGFLERCGTPVGFYSWGKVEAIYDRKAAQGMATISYAAQRTAARDRVKKRDA